jgi:poly-beta-1,6-N-acetyl-D-glucosamine biosynthesis protein PgaD
MAAFNQQLDKQLNLQLDKKQGIPAFIYRADLQSRFQKGTSVGLMMMFWTFFIYFFTPTVTLLAWVLGYQQLNQYIVQDSQSFLNQVTETSKLIVVMGSVFVLWAIYHRPFFRNKYLYIPPVVNLGEIAKHFKLSREVVIQAQRRQVNIFQFNELGLVIDIIASKYKELNRLSFCGRDCCKQHESGYEYHAIE